MCACVCVCVCVCFVSNVIGDFKADCSSCVLVCLGQGKCAGFVSVDVHVSGVLLEPD